MNNPFTNRVLRNWYFNNAKIDLSSKFPNGIIIIGGVPFEKKDYMKFIKKAFKVNASLQNNENLVNEIVLGRSLSDTDKEQLMSIRLKLAKKHENMYIYSQEMFLLVCMGHDPYSIVNSEDRIRILNLLSDGHLGIQYLLRKRNTKYQWPIRSEVNNISLGSKKHSQSSKQKEIPKRIILESKDQGLSKNHSFRPYQPDGKYGEDYGTK